MNSKPNDIDKSANSNGHCGITITVPESEYNETDFSPSTETLAMENAIEKISSTENYASRRKLHDSVKDDEEIHEENEVGNEGDRKSVDGVDGPMKVRLQYEEMEEVFLDGDADAAEDNTLKKSSNGYAAKKTVAQGMMDIALITANANQLRYMVEYNQHSPTYYINLILISFSLVLQVGIGVALIMKGRLDIKGRSKGSNAKKINNYVIIGVFMVTIINVFIASFTVTGSAPTAALSVPATTLV